MGTIWATLKQKNGCYMGYAHKYWYYLGYTNKIMGTICVTLTNNGYYLGYADKKWVLSVLH